MLGGNRQESKNYLRGNVNCPPGLRELRRVRGNSALSSFPGSPTLPHSIVSQSPIHRACSSCPSQRPALTAIISGMLLLLVRGLLAVCRAAGKLYSWCEVTKLTCSKWFGRRADQSCELDAAAVTRTSARYASMSAHTIIPRILSRLRC